MKFGRLPFLIQCYLLVSEETRSFPLHSGGHTVPVTVHSHHPCQGQRGPPEADLRFWTCPHASGAFPCLGPVDCFRVTLYFVSSQPWNRLPPSSFTTAPLVPVPPHAVNAGFSSSSCVTLPSKVRDLPLIVLSVWA